MNVDATPTYLTEIEFKAHPVGKEFIEVCEQLGIDLSKWEYSYCEHDTEPYQYYNNDSPPWRHGRVSYNHPKLENHTLWSDFNDDGGWELDTIQITQD